MDEKARRRHTNPYSGYSKFSSVPLIGLAVWSRIWLGWWSIILIVLFFYGYG
ncbi:MAG: DUF6653 family protein [candidate division WOR-3 bacterium]